MDTRFEGVLIVPASWNRTVTIGVFMVRVFEIVLDIPDRAMRARPSQTAATQRSHAALHAQTQWIAALSAMQGVKRLSQRDETLTVCCLDHDRMLADQGWQVALETSSAGHHVKVSRHSAYSPGVAILESVHEFAAPLATDALSPAAFDGAPQVLKDAVAAAGELSLAAKFSAERMRWQWSVEGAPVVDILLEQVVPSAASDWPAHREVRLATSCNEDQANTHVQTLFGIANQLIDNLPVFPALGTVCERMCRGDSPMDTTPVRASPVDLGGATTPHAALIAICGNLAEHWFGNDAGVRDATTMEFVHQMRVAQRRLRTAMRIFPEWADEAWDAHIAVDLKWLGSVLGDARDWDVFADSTLPALADADVDPSNWTHVRERANARRLEMRERAQEALCSPRYARLALAWLQWLGALPARGEPAAVKQRSLHAYARKRVRKYYRRLISAPKLTALDERARHQERIQAKRLRYTLEFFESISSPKTRGETAKTLARMQSVLGDGNDAAVALSYLELLDAEPYVHGFARGWCEAAKRYTAAEGERLLRTLRKPKITGGNAA